MDTRLTFMARALSPSPDDECFLDLLFDRILELLEEGGSPRAAELAADRPHLLPRVEELIRLAHDIRPEAGGPLPHVPGYTLLRELGRGGMGAVYLARQERLGGRPVALKILPPAVALSARARERFRDEARVIARLSHPNIVAVHDVVAADGLHAYAMEWVDGRSLAGWIAERHGEQTDVAFVCRVGIAVARALHAVHAAGLLHRDVKPANILLRRDGTPLLSDFGLVHETDATLTQPGHFVGTLAYASPEQLRGDDNALDARTDVYALGVTMYHALALRLPVDGHRPEQALRRIEAGHTVRLRRVNQRVPRDLETIVAKAMDADPSRRYQTCDQLADDLTRLLSLQPIQARPAGLLTWTIKLARRKRGLLIAAIAGALLAAAALIAIGMYLFVVPRWVAAHVSKAQLTLLHPDQANEIISRVFWGSPGSYVPETLAAARSMFAGALSEYDAALHLAPFDRALRQERAVVAAAEKAAVESGPSRSVQQEDARSRGLFAYLSFDARSAIDAWSRWEQERDPLAPADPLVAAALGILYLADDQPARAYPRLQDACTAFPDVGFLTVYLADAALQCGDLGRAEQLLERAKSMGQHDPLGALERVTADMLAATGRYDEADAAYRGHRFVIAPAGPAAFNYARFLEGRGRLDESLELYAAISSGVPDATKPARALVRVMDRWWAAMPAGVRLRRMRAALDAHPYDSRSLASQLRQYLGSRAVLVGDAPWRSASAVHHSIAFPLWLAALAPPFQISTALFDTISSPSLGKRSLSQLARGMEIENMALWSTITAYPRVIKDLHAAAWRYPWAAPLRRMVHRIYRFIESGRAPRSTATLAGAVLGLAGPAAAQEVTFFDGTFDLADWTVTIATYFNGGTHTFIQDTGGNPAPSLRMQNTVAVGWESWVAGVHFRNGATYDPSVSGPIRSIDYSSDYLLYSGGGDGQAECLALRQGGNIYIGAYHLTNAPTWTRWSVNGLTACSFRKGAAPPFDWSAFPDFSASGSPIEFGFWRANSGSGDTKIGGIDNWSVTIHHDPPPTSVVPIVEFGFDEGSGATATNTGSLRCRADGALTGPSWSTDTRSGSGFSLQFDGVDDRVEVPDAFDYGSELTIEAWIKPDVVGGQRFLWDDYGSPGVLLAISNGSLQFTLSTQQNPGLGVSIVAGTIVPGQWQHVAATYDGTKMRAYINGCLVGTRTTSGTIIDNANWPSGIGSDNPPNPPALVFDGLIDDFRIYDVALWGPPAGCPGDADGDGDVDQDDLDLVLFFFGSTTCGQGDGDVNVDGVVDQEDMDLVLFYFDTSCP